MERDVTRKLRREQSELTSALTSPIPVPHALDPYCARLKEQLSTDRLGHSLQRFSIPIVLVRLFFLQYN